MKHVFVYFLACMMLGIATQAQNNQLDNQENNYSLSESTQQLPIYGFVNLTSLIEYYGSVNVGVQKKINRSEYLSVEAGYIYSLIPKFYDIGQQGTNEPIKDTWGIKLLFDYRFDLNVKGDYTKESTYVSISPYIYYANYKSELVAGYDCNDQFGRCSFYRLFQLNTKRIMPGFYFNWGMEYDFDIIKMSVSLGLGLRYITNYNNVPEVPLVDKFYIKGGGAAEIPEGFYPNLKASYILYFKYR